MARDCIARADALDVGDVLILGGVVGYVAGVRDLTMWDHMCPPHRATLTAACSKAQAQVLAERERAAHASPRVSH